MAQSGAGTEATAMTSDTIFTVSVLRSKKTGEVLFVEAGKDFVDTLISFLLLPVGTILYLLSNFQFWYPGHKLDAGAKSFASHCINIAGRNAHPGQVKPFGGISSIFASMGNMDSSLLHVDKKHLVEPRPAAIGTSRPTGLLKCLKASLRPALSEQVVPWIPKVYYGCGNPNCNSISNVNEKLCDMCCRPKPGTTWLYTEALDVHYSDLVSISSQMRNILDGPDDHATLSPKGHGYVSESTMYLVTDGLEIMPSTTIKSMKILNQLNYTTLAGVESNDVPVNITQVLQLLRSALISSTCLTDVFGKR